VWWTQRDGSLSVDTYPGGAEVWVGSTLRGSTRLDLSLSSGEYDLVLRKPGYLPVQERIRIEAGQPVPFARSLVPADVDDLLRSQPVEEKLQIPGIQLRIPEQHRGTGADDTFPLALLPRGRVRRADLASVHLRVGDAYEDGTTKLVFRAGQRVLFEEPFALGSGPVGDLERPIPPAVLAALEPGLEVTWGFEPPKPRRDVPPSPLAKGRFVLVADDAHLEERLARLSAEFRQSPVYAGILRAQLLLASDLPLAAYAEARALALSEAGRAAIRPAALWWEAVERLRITDLDDGIVREAREAVLLRFSPEQRRAFFGVR
jgi:hypothetical protein